MSNYQDNKKMKLKKYITICGVTSALLSLTSCNDFLSTLPDNRAEVKGPEDVRSLLITAYPEKLYSMYCEYSSDNVVHNVEADANTKPFYDQIYAWEDITETDNDDPRGTWESCYGAIQTANAALEIIEKAGNPANLQAQKGEALLCRAFNHFVLVNVFAEAYDAATAANKLGVPYNTRPETTLKPTYTRESIAGNYEHIAKDIEEGLPLISDNSYSVPKYHFNKKAAEAFAARFYLYYQKWDLAKKYASQVLGSNVKGLLRDYDALLALPSGSDGFKNRALKFIDPSNANNLLLIASYSGLGRIYGFYTIGARYTHSDFVAAKETVEAPNAWGSTELKLKGAHVQEPYRKILFPRYPEQFEITDRIAGTGYLRTTQVEFTTDETLLIKAEAEIMLGEKEAALADMNAYLSNAYSGRVELTEQKIKTWNKETKYSTPQLPTPRKQLNPSWTITPEQEEYLQVLLHLRRIETIHTGLRWFDVKRYGIEITRVDVSDGSKVTVTSNVLKKDDKRRALQLPADVITAGLAPNRK